MSVTKRSEEIRKKKDGLGRYRKHTYRELAEEYGYSLSNIYRIVHNIRTKERLKNLEDYGV